MARSRTMPHAHATEQVEVDILDVSDLRFVGGTSRSVAEEIKAQAEVGYTTAVMHIDGPLQARVAPFNPSIRRCLDNGLASLVLSHQRVRAKLVVVRHPAVLQHADLDAIGVQTDRLVVVANAAPRDIDGYEHYRVSAVREAAVRLFGVEPIWAPIGPLVRQAIIPDLDGQAVLEDDWVNIIDVDAWSAERTGWLSDRPVIGRHSRDNPQKWPADQATLEAAYPTDGSMHVRVLGGAAPAADLLGSIPDSWDVLPFGAMSPREFLAGIEFFVYYHNPRWVEAFGRTILEALASGAVAVLPHHFKALFGDAAVYAPPEEARAHIERLYADRSAYEDQASKGQQLARQRFGHEAHVERVTALIGPPRGSSERHPPVRRKRHNPALLMISSNGSGMGHLTRLLAYAQRSGPELRPYFLSLSQAVPIVGSFGYPFEYVPSMKATGLEPARWQEYFGRRVAELIRRIQPAAVVFDGTVPYEAIPQVREQYPGVRWVWSRRGMWYRGLNRDQLRKSDWFDLVVEPGDLAAPADQGVTADAPAMRVGPVTLLDPTDLDDRSVARDALGLEAERPAALVTLGAGNINNPTGDLRTIVGVLADLDVQICVTRPEIAEHSVSTGRPVSVVREFPLSRRHRAFDLAVSAAGYNSFHELLRFGVPTLFVPNLKTSLDDQRTRARYAAAQGWAHAMDEPQPHTARKLLEDLLENGPAMVSAVAAADPGNGAVEFMSMVTDVVERQV